MENGSFIVDLFCQNDDVPLCKRLPEGNLFEVMVVHDLDDWGGTPVTGWKPHHHLSSNKKSHVYPFSTISIAMLNYWKNIQPLSPIQFRQKHQMSRPHSVTGMMVIMGNYIWTSCFRLLNHYNLSVRIGAYPTRKGPEKSPFVASILRKNDPLHNLDGGLSLYYSKVPPVIFSWSHMISNFINSYPSYIQLSIVFHIVIPYSLMLKLLVVDRKMVKPWKNFVRFSIWHSVGLAQIGAGRW